MNEERMISNSEVSTWLHCSRKYYFEYVLNVEQKKSPTGPMPPLAKGTFVHAILEAYYAGKQLGYAEAQCRADALQIIMDAASLEGADIADIGATRDLVMGYFDKYMDLDDEWEVVAVESKYKAEITERFSLVGTIDLILRNKTTGDFVGVDHKTAYNFWRPEQIEIAGQFVKYIVLMRAAGMDSAAFMVNQIRTRTVKTGDLYVRAYTRPTEARVKAVLKQHIKAGNEIMDYRESGSNIEDTIPILDKHGCANCDFMALCDASIEGSPIAYVLQSEYQERTGYGYNED